MDKSAMGLKTFIERSRDTKRREAFITALPPLLPYLHDVWSWYQNNTELPSKDSFWPLRLFNRFLWEPCSYSIGRKAHQSVPQKVLLNVLPAFLPQWFLTLIHLAVNVHLQAFYSWSIAVMWSWSSLFDTICLLFLAWVPFHLGLCVWVSLMHFMLHSFWNNMDAWAYTYIYFQTHPLLSLTDTQTYTITHRCAKVTSATGLAETLNSCCDFSSLYSKSLPTMTGASHRDRDLDLVGE